MRLGKNGISAIQVEPNFVCLYFKRDLNFSTSKIFKNSSSESVLED
jgi:hypothetical protein